jgi:plastocyanin
MNPMPRPSLRAAALAAVAALFVAACGPTAAPGWTFAPLGPTPPPAEPPPGETPAPGETPDPGEVVTLQVTTPQENQLAFEPNQLQAPPGTQVTVEYLNDSTLLHNIHFFSGPDVTAPSLAATELVTGPGALETVTFTTPDEPGDLFFHCDVHPDMTGTLTVGE